MATYRVKSEFVYRDRRISPKDTREWTPPSEEVAERLVRAGCLRRLPGPTPEPNEVTKEPEQEQEQEQRPEQGPETAAEAPAPKSKRTKRSRK